MKRRKLFSAKKSLFKISSKGENEFDNENLLIIDKIQDLKFKGRIS